MKLLLAAIKNAQDVGLNIKISTTLNPKTLSIDVGEHHRTFVRDITNGGWLEKDQIEEEMAGTIWKEIGKSGN